MIDIKQNVYKLIIAGPVGVGKTHAIQALSDKDIITTEELSSDEVKYIKKTTTVAMDFGVMKLDHGDTIRVYGTPGQKRFDFMWEILSENALGLVLLLNAEDEDPVKDLEYYTQKFMPLIQGSSMVVGITHAENIQWDLHQRLSDYLILQGITPNVAIVDARNRGQMRQLVSSLIHMMIN